MFDLMKVLLVEVAVAVAREVADALTDDNDDEGEE